MSVSYLALFGVNEIGTPYIRNFKKSDYNVSTQNKSVSTYYFEGADVQPGVESWKWWSDPVSYDVVVDAYYNQEFYNMVRIMLYPGVGTETHTFCFDDLSGPHVEGIHK